MRRTLCLFSLVVPFLLIAACSSEEKKPPVAGDGTAGGGAGAGGRGSEAGAGEGGIDADVDGGSCTLLENTGLLVTRLGVAGEPPTQTGGTISPGTYDLKDVSVFVGIGGVGGPTGEDYKESIRITGAVLERIRSIKDNNNGQTSVSNETYSFAASQSNFAIAQTCPLNTAALPDQYTATDTQITIVASLTKEVFVYQKH